MYKGKEKIVLKYLGFLVDQYNMTYSFQTFPEYYGFYGPIDYYSFYNTHGCFTLQNIVQRDEWGWYIAKKFSNNQYLLLEKSINQTNYITKTVFTARGMLRKLSALLKEEALNNKTIFNIPLFD